MRLYHMLALAMVASPALGVTGMSELQACEIYAKSVQSIEKREALLPSRRVVSETARASAPGTTGSDATPQFTWPVNLQVIEYFCSNHSNRRTGVDIAAPEGSVVKAAADGVVAYAGDQLRGYGKLVLIRHGKGWITAYAYNSELLVKRGDQVQQGQSISLVGYRAAGSPRLHFEIRRGSGAVDPLDYLPNR